MTDAAVMIEFRVKSCRACEKLELNREAVRHK